MRRTVFAFLIFFVVDDVVVVTNPSEIFGELKDDGNKHNFNKYSRNFNRDEGQTLMDGIIKLLSTLTDAENKTFDQVWDKLEELSGPLEDFQEKFLYEQVQFQKIQVTGFATLLKSIPPKELKKWLITTLKSTKKFVKSVGIILQEFIPPNDLNAPGVFRRLFEALSHLGGGIKKVASEVDEIFVAFSGIQEEAFEELDQNFDGYIQNIERIDADSLSRLTETFLQLYVVLLEVKSENPSMHRGNKN